MSRSIRFALWAALFAAWAVLAGPATAGVKAGAPAPALQGRDLEGHDIDLASERGRVVIVSLWATWCAPCRLEMPILDQAYRRHHGEGLDVIGVSADRPRNLNDVKRAMQGLAYPTLMASDARTNGFGARRALPQTFVIDRNGVVRAVFGVLGQPVTEAAVETAVRTYLAEGPETSTGR